MVTVHVVLRMIPISVIIPHHRRRLVVAVVVEAVHRARHKHLAAAVAALLHRQALPQAVVATGITMDIVPMAPLVMDHTMMTNGQMTGGIRTI